MGSPFALWPPPATPLSTSATCCWTPAGRWPCSAAGRCWSGTVARTDLAGPELTEPLARAAYQSLHQRLLSLPDELAVYPTHGAGSFCSAPVGGERTTTIGAERRYNRLLAAPNEDAFVAQLLAGFGSYPPYFLRLRERNRVGPELLTADWRVLPLLPTDRVRAHLAGGGVLVDARPIGAFAAGHIPRALSIELRPQFASWLGWLVNDAQPLVVRLGRGPGPRRAGPPVPHHRL